MAGVGQIPSGPLTSLTVQVLDKAVRGPSRRLELMLRGLFRQCEADETLVHRPSSSSLLLSSLELRDTTIYEPQIRALLGTASHELMLRGLFRQCEADETLVLQPSALNPEPSKLNPKPQTQTLNPTPLNLNLKHPRP